MQLPLLIAAHDRVPGVVATLKAHDRIGLLREQVGDLSLPLVAPLGADYHDSGHTRGQCRRGRAQARGAGARNSRRLSSPKSGMRSPQISTRRETVREPSLSESSSGMRLVVATIARSDS